MIEVDMTESDVLQVKSVDTKVSLEIRINKNGFFKVIPFQVTNSD